MRRGKALIRAIAIIIAATMSFTSMPLYVFADDEQGTYDEIDNEQDNKEDSASENNADVSVNETVSDNAVVEESGEISDASETVLDSVSDNDIAISDELPEELYEEYSVGIYEELSASDVAAYFDVPYVATYHFNPKPATSDNIQIKLYMTDAAQSEYLLDDNTKTLDLLYEVDGNQYTKTNLPLGDYTLELGKLSEGNHVFTVQVVDRTTGIKSHKLYNDLWVVDQAKYNITASQIYTMTSADLTNYKINNKDSQNAADMNNTRNGLNQLFEDKRAAGFRKIVLLPGTYRINGEDSDSARGSRSNAIKIPSEFTVDMNGSTFKLNPILADLSFVSTQNASTTKAAIGCLILFDNTVDSHLTNGTLVGDRFERKDQGLESDSANRSGMGEQINTVLMKGGKYNTISNMTIKDTTGHTIVKFYEWGKETFLGGYTRTAIIDGVEVAADNCSTSSLTDLSTIINDNKASKNDKYMGENYMYVGHPQGYRGIYGNSPIVYVTFYDSNKKLVETVTGYQYRKIQIPDYARYARVTLYGTTFMDYSPATLDSTVSIYSKHFGDYFEFTDIDFIDTRTCALAPATCNNLLIEGCTYTRSGNSITPAAVDLEDGAQECQDVYYIDNIVLEKAGTCDIIDNYGFNHMLIGNTNHSYEVRNRVAGGLITGINDGTSTVLWKLGDKAHTPFGRVFDNNCGMINVTDLQGYDYPNGQLHEIREPNPVNFKVKNCEIHGGTLNSSPKCVEYDDCTFYSINPSNAKLRNCTVQFYGGVGSQIGSELYCYDCTFKTLDGSTVHNMNWNQAVNAVRIFENCKFLGKTVPNNYLASATFRNCEFEDISITGWASNRSSSEATLFENCTFNSTGGYFFNVGPTTNTVGYINFTFKNCQITHTGKNLVQKTASTTAGSQVVFDSCTINKQVDTSVDPTLFKVTNQSNLLDTTFNGCSLGLNGDIILNFDIRIPDSIRNNSSAVVHFTLPGGGSYDVKTSNGVASKNNAGSYIYSCSVPASRMNDNIIAQVQIISDGKVAQVGDVYSCSVRKYAEAIVNNPGKYDAAVVAVVKSMLNYGGYAQQYFGVDTNNLVNKNLYSAGSDPVLSSSQAIPTIAVNGAMLNSELNYIGCSLVCKGQTGMKFYFKISDGVDKTKVADRYSVSVLSNNKTRVCQDSVSDGMYVVYLSNIAAAELDDVFTFTITDTSKKATTIKFNYSPLNYMNQAQKSSDKSLVNLTRAMYLYNQAANQCFN